MESAEELTARRLENRTYRQLQQMAKSMGLPSNFKKIYLIELIVAKRFKSDTEVVGIIHRVRQERLYQSKVKKRSQLRKIKYQVSSQRIPEPRNSICYSPPITVTPKRSSNVDMQYSPEIMCKAIVPINPKRNLMRNITNTQNTIMPPISSSDRVLRSYNMKTLKPNYALINNNIEEIKTQCCSDTERKFKIITNRGFPQFNVRAKCYVRRNKSLLEDNSRAVLKRQYIIPHGRDVTRTPLPAKRQRTISGIYPLNPEETVPRNLATNQSVCLRKTDGSYTRINALVQKCNVNVMKINNRSRNPEINIEEIIDKIDVNMPEDLTNENNNYLKIQYPNTSGLDLITSDSSTQIALHHHFKENVLSSDTQLLEYENKRRTEQLRCQRIWDMGRQKLPKINDAFSRFSNVHWRDPTQPLYVQVGTELENVPIHMNTQPTLETVYNIRTTAPPTPNVTRPINSTTCTNCVDTIRTYPTV
ncbi:jg25160 [Pararge aegeria aegeria]|uniref:Jg25160 protein n=2 Tax=Pararge aegeria TaxID=116150 RepID=A0A8S4RX76_9NEOP|nr:jg25160 [Pararge aegeria aegeria]